MSVDPLPGAPLPGAPLAGPADGPALSAPGVVAPTLSGAGRRFLSDILVELGFVDQTDAEHAVEAARSPGMTPEKVLLQSGAITEEQLARALAERYGLEYIDLTEFPVDESAAALLRKTAAKRYLAAPVGFAGDGALVLAVSDPADSLGLSDIAVMTKLPVRPAVAARSEIAKLLETLDFMEEPVFGSGDVVSTVIVPPEETVLDEPPDVPAADDAPASEVARPDPRLERELARLREELAMALVERDKAVEELETRGDHVESAVAREREEALASLRGEHERELAAREAAAEEAVRNERASAQQALSALRAKHEEAVAALKAKHEDAVAALKARHDEELSAERAKRADEVEAERARTTAAIDAERERTAKELEALRARLTEELDAVRDQVSKAVAPDELAVLQRELAEARELVELTADADRRAEAARAALAALRDENERQAQVAALTERELRAELEQVRAELESLRAELPEPSKK